MAEAAAEGEVEFVHEVTSGLPTKVMGRLMGLPEEDWGALHDLAERQTTGRTDVDGDETDTRPRSRWRCTPSSSRARAGPRSPATT